MRDGGPFPPDHHIHRFNGGLFEDLKELEQLRIPNRVFCAKGQGESRENLAEFKNTLLYLSGTYNFGATSEMRERTITLYALGRIFEQSITDLEYMHAEADGVPTIAKLSKRKRDGVYYTPEWVTSYIVQQVIGRRLSEERDRIGLGLGEEIPQDALLKYRRAKSKPKTNRATIHIKRLDEYEKFLDRITILDPACGSGAFLIQALQYLQQHRRDLATERERVTGQASVFDQDAVIRSILSDNLFGVDINPESVEITQLALWLNTAAPGKPLSTLSDNILCGNSLVGKDFAEFYRAKHSTLFEDANRDEQEKVNAFDWSDNFPTILGPDIPEKERGFDCVIGNPPYVKLQHFRKVVPDVAEYLVKAKLPEEAGANSGNAVPKLRYGSTQTKNFDLYLPFIERGISLLDRDGHMGFIAPSVWLLNEYGEGLKKRLVESRRLERWVDFKDFPVFEEAMTYTALQFYGGKPSSSIAFALASDGELASIEDEGFIDYDSLDPGDTWVFLPDRERRLIDRLREAYTPLGELNYVESIFVGIQTSADHIYHLERMGPGRYRQKGSEADGVVHPVEDGMMNPLVSGIDAKRYQSPQPTTHLLFPYDLSGDTPRLWTESEMEAQFPNAWKYLKKYETPLRRRERGKMDDDSSWWAYNYPKNLDKQQCPKLGVAQTVPEMRVFYDSEGKFYLNNVRVNGILVNQSHALFILGILNSRVADFVFRRSAKPKEPRPSGAYFEANKQYIEPIPIPSVTNEQRGRVATLAERLHELHSARRDTIQTLNARIESAQMRPDERKPSWIWADVRDAAAWSKANPDGLAGRKLRSWAKSHYEQLLEAHLSDVNDRISFGQTMLATSEDGQLKYFVGNECVIDVFVSGDDAKIILPQWQEKARDTFVSESMNAKRILTRLLDLCTTDNEALVEQLAVHTKTLQTLDNQILQTESEMDDYVYELYGLDAHERAIVEAATEQRANARVPRVLQ